MRKNPERVAWIILLSSFLIFCLCIISIPLAIRWYVYNATDSLTATLTSIKGTALVRNAREEQSIPVPRGATEDIDELSIITTDDTSQAILTFFEGTEITLYHNSTAIIHRTRKPRFDISSHPNEIRFELLKGRIRANVPPANDKRIIGVASPHGLAELSAGSYAFEVVDGQTQISARSGEAVVSAQEQTVLVNQNQLTTIAAGNPPSPTQTAEQDLIQNGDFSQPLEGSWQTATFIPADVVQANVRLSTDGDRNILVFKSEGEDNIHTEASIQQNVNKDIEDFQSLRISADIRLNFQSLPGGGQIGTEFPVMIELAYRDANGNDRNWFHGFYYEPPPGNYILYNEPDNASEAISQFVWYPYESDNLLAALGPAKPVFIKYLRVYASGWIYDSMVTNIKLSAQE